MCKTDRNESRGLRHFRTTVPGWIGRDAEFFWIPYAVCLLVGTFRHRFWRAMIYMLPKCALSNVFVQYLKFSVSVIFTAIFKLLISYFFDAWQNTFSLFVLSIQCAWSQPVLRKLIKVFIVCVWGGLSTFGILLYYVVLDPFGVLNASDINLAPVWEPFDLSQFKRSGIGVWRLCLSTTKPDLLFVFTQTDSRLLEWRRVLRAQERQDSNTSNYNHWSSEWIRGILLFWLPVNLSRCQPAHVQTTLWTSW